MRQFVITFSKYWGVNSASVPYLFFFKGTAPCPPKSTPLLNGIPLYSCSCTSLIIKATGGRRKSSSFWAGYGNLWADISLVPGNPDHLTAGLFRRAAQMARFDRGAGQGRLLGNWAKYRYQYRYTSSGFFPIPKYRYYQKWSVLEALDISYVCLL